MNWVSIVKCLRSIGTETKLVKRYIDLCIIGDSTIPERYEIIKTTKEKALKQMEELKNQLALLDYKEEHYKNLIKNNLNEIMIDECVILSVTGFCNTSDRPWPCGGATGERSLPLLDIRLPCR